MLDPDPVMKRAGPTSLLKDSETFVFVHVLILYIHYSTYRIILISVADPFHETARIIENFVEKINHNNRNIKKKYICLTDINIYPINNKTDNSWNHFFIIEKKKEKVGIFSIYVGSGSGSI